MFLKIFVVTGISVLFYFAIGTFLPVTETTALTIRALHEWGYLSYRGLMALVVFGLLYNRVSV